MRPLRDLFIRIKKEPLFENMLDRLVHIELMIQEIQTQQLPRLMIWRTAHPTVTKVHHKIDKIKLILDQVHRYFGDTTKFIESHKEFASVEKGMYMDKHYYFRIKKLENALDKLVETFKQINYDDPRDVQWKVFSIEHSLEDYFRQTNYTINKLDHLRQKVLDLVNEIKHEAKKDWFYLENGRKVQLLYCDVFSRRKLLLLNNIPLLPFDHVYHRSEYLCAAHIDSTLNVDHYNVLLDNGKINIHVVAKEDAQKLLQRRAA